MAAGGHEPQDANLMRSVFSELLDRLVAEIGISDVLVSRDMEQIAPDLDARARVIEDPFQLASAVNEAHEGCLVVPPWVMDRSQEVDFWSNVTPRRGSLVALVPGSSLPRRLPRLTAEIGVARSVVVGQPELGGIHAAFVAAAVEFGPFGHGPEVTRFFTIPHRLGAGADAEVRKDFVRLMKQEGGTTKYGFIYRGPSLVGKSLLAAEYDPRIKARIEDLTGFGGEAVVTDVFDVLRPTPGKRTRQTQSQVSSALHGRVLRGRDITLAGEVVPAELDDDAVPRPADGDVPLRVGDFLMRDLIRPVASTQGLPAMVRESDLPAAAATSLVVLRPKNPLSREEAEFYRSYLGSRRCLETMRISGMRRSTHFSQAPLPRPDGDLLDALEQIGAARRTLSTWTEEAMGLSTEAFEAPAAETREQLIEKGRLLRLRVEAAEQIGTLEHRIANFYPYPIAHKWRVVRVAEGASDDRRTYEAILDCFEATLSFTAAIALAFARRHDLPVAAMEEIRRKLGSPGRGGTSLGDWVRILKEVSSGRAFRQVDPGSALAIVRQSLPEGSAAARAQERLSSRRNDESHQRRVDDLDLPANKAQARADLEVVLEHLAFLADLPVMQIDSAKWDSINHKSSVIASVLRGDQPVAATTQFDYAASGIEAGSLYVKDIITGELVLLRPFLVRQECPRCRAWSTFHPDRRSPEGLLLKAVDHPHTINGSALEGVLSAVGYI